MKIYVPDDQISITNCIASVVAQLQPSLFRAVPNHQKFASARKVCLFELEAFQKVRKTLQLKEHIEIDIISNLSENVHNLALCYRKLKTISSIRFKIV